MRRSTDDILFEMDWRQWKQGAQERRYARSDRWLNPDNAMEEGRLAFVLAIAYIYLIIYVMSPLMYCVDLIFGLFYITLKSAMRAAGMAVIAVVILIVGYYLLFKLALLILRKI